MTYPINCQNQQIPGYSGITINITNPNISAGVPTNQCPPPPNYQCYGQNHVGHDCPVTNPMYNKAILPPQGEQKALPQQFYYQDMIPVQNAQTEPKTVATVQEQPSSNMTEVQELKQVPTNFTQQGQQAYPPEYYINNYNYIQNDKQSKTPNEPIKQVEQPVVNQVVQTQEPESLNQVPVANPPQVIEPQEEDMTSSTNIINELDTKLAEQKNLEKTGKKTRIVALTNEYIMSLENYLNNPNTEIRLMAAKEILTRLDEDKDRFDDAALNALLNKMLQDPEKLVRVAALSAFTSDLASGNDYTVKLLNDIQSNPNADKDDVVDAANILLKMSAATEVKYTPQPPQKVVVEQKAK